MKTNVLKWLILLILVLIWGTSFLLMKRGLQVYSDSTVGTLRIFIAFVITLPFALSHIKKLPAAKWKFIAITGILGTGLPALLFAKAQMVISSSVAGVLNSLTPLFTLITGILLFSQKASLLRISGVITGLIGAAGLVYVSGDQAFEFHFSHAMLIVLATFFYAIQSNVVKTYLYDVHTVTITALGFFIIGVPAGIYLFFFTDFLKIFITESRGVEGVFYVAILSIFGSVIALILYNRLVQITNPVFATSLTYLVPVVAILWGFLDGERFPAISLAFVTLILIGVFLVNKNDYFKKNTKN